jgi:hypothetical protein
LKTGKLKVRDAKLPHFSRYGFVNWWNENVNQTSIWK